MNFILLAVAIGLLCFVEWVRRQMQKVKRELDNAADALRQPTKKERVWFSRN